jgi:hypothetical protein
MLRMNTPLILIKIVFIQAELRVFHSSYHGK